MGWRWWRQVWCICSVKTVWSIPECFRGELLTMGRYTNLHGWTSCWTTSLIMSYHQQHLMLIVFLFKRFFYHFLKFPISCSRLILLPTYFWVHIKYFLDWLSLKQAYSIQIDNFSYRSDKTAADDHRATSAMKSMPTQAPYRHYIQPRHPLNMMQPLRKCSSAMCNLLVKIHSCRMHVIIASTGQQLIMRYIKSLMIQFKLIERCTNKRIHFTTFKKYSAKPMDLKYTTKGYNYV